MGDHFHDPIRPTARKMHQCIACLHPIALREVYVMQSGYFEGRAFRNKYHSECWAALCDEPDWEFTPGDLDPPERLTGAPKS